MRVPRAAQLRLGCLGLRVLRAPCSALVYLFALLSVLYLFCVAFLYLFLILFMLLFFKKSTRLKPAHARSSSRSTAEIFRFAQIEIQSAFRPPTRTLLAASLPSTSTSLLPAAHLFITVRICGEALTEILAFAVLATRQRESWSEGAQVGGIPLA